MRRIVLLLGCCLLAAVASVPAQQGGGPLSPAREYVRVIPGTSGPDGLWRPGSIIRYRLEPGEYLPNVVVLKTRSYPNPDKGAVAFRVSEIDAALAPYGVRNIRIPFPEFGRGMIFSADRFGLGRISVVTLGAPADLPELCERLMRSPNVEYAEPMLIRRRAAAPNDPLYADQYALRRMQVEGAWEITHGDTNLTIAVVDSGIDWGHEDLKDHIRTNPNEIPGNDIDDDNNGKVDDVYGWDFVGNISDDEGAIGLFRPDGNPRIDSAMAPDDLRHHGTHVAGIAAAGTNNGAGIAGVAYGCKVLPVKISSDSSSESLYRTFEGILYAAISGATVINCSWGNWAYSQAEQDAIDQVTAMGVTVVACAGNEGKRTDAVGFYPAAYRNVISVGATDVEDRAASFSNYGVTTWVYAPGEEILSTISGANRYASETWSGTSMATPMVSGLAALLKSLHPDWLPAQIAHQIRATVDNVIVTDTLLRPWYIGRVNARRALETNRRWSGPGSLPGIGVVDRLLDAPGGIIRDVRPTRLRVTLRNHLGDASNVRVTFSSLEGDVIVSDESILIDSLEHMSDRDIEISVRIDPASPWLEGRALLTAKFESGEYRNYELVEIPYKLTSANVYTAVSLNIPPGARFVAAHAPAPAAMWSAVNVPEYGTGYLRYDGANFAADLFGESPLTCIEAIDANVAFTASGADIFHTEDAGGEWMQDSSLRSVMGEIRAIHFFSRTEGIALGLPRESKLSVAVTTDGGSVWQPIAGPSIASQSDYFSHAAVCWVGDSGWVITRAGNQYRTTDRGRSWEVSALTTEGAVHVAFSSRREGMLLYPVDAEGRRHHGAVTTDGGASWDTGAFDLGEISLTPVHLAAPVGIAGYIVLGDDGRIALSRDGGRNWSFLATAHTRDTSVAGAVSAFSPTKVRVWNLGTAVGYLDADLGGSASIDESRDGAPFVLALYPNPSTMSTVIEYEVDESGWVMMEIVDARGERMALPVDQAGAIGRYSVRVDVSGYPSGRYFCRLRLGDRTHVAELQIVR